MPEMPKIGEFLLGLGKKDKKAKLKPDAREAEAQKEATKSGNKKREQKAKPQMSELKEQALEVLFGQYQKAKAEAIALKSQDIKKALATLGRADQLLGQIEALRKNPSPLIDDLEKILESGPKKSKEAAAAGGIEAIAARTPEGKEVRFELKEQLEYWSKFYQEHGVDWAKLPEEIKVTTEQAAEIKRLISELGFDQLIIAPENLAATGEDYEKLQRQMSTGYKETWQSDNFTEDGFAGLKNKSDKLRLIITKEFQNLEDDELGKATLGKSIEDLEAKDGLFKQKGIGGFDPAAYLVYQREYFERTGKHLDESGWTWLPEVGRPASGRVPYGDWHPDAGRLHFRSDSPDSHDGDLGCRPAGSLEIVT